MAQQRIHFLAALIQDFKETDINLAVQELAKRVVLLMGQTKAGKTTLLYYLLGKELIWEKNQIDIWQMRPEAVYLNAIIGNGYESTTVYPNIPPCESQQEVMIIDMPGFDDSRPHFRLLNLYILQKTITLIKNVHVCLVLPEESLNSKDLFRQLQKLYKLFNRQFLKSQKNMSFVITKFQNEDSAQIKDILYNGLQQILSEELSEEFHDTLNMIKRNKIYYFANKEPLIAEGIELKSRIVQENLFFEIDDHKNMLLSEEYQEVMIGDSHVEQFQEYIKDLMKIIAQISPFLFHLADNAIKLEFIDIFCLLEDREQREFKKEIEERISSLLQTCNQQSIKTLKVKFNIKKQLHLTKFINIFRIFSILEEIFHKKDISGHHSALNMYVLVLEKYKQMVILAKEGYNFVDNNFFHILEQYFRYFKVIIQTIISTKQCLTQYYDGKFNISQQVLISLANISNLWKNNQHKITQMASFQAISNDQSIKNLYGQAIDGQAIEIVEVVQKIPVLSRIRNKKILEQLSKSRSINIIQEDQEKREVEESNITICDPKLIKQMADNEETLQKLLNMLDSNTQKSLELRTVKILLSKIAVILCKYSFFEEAIMFRMAFHDENSIEVLFKLGMNAMSIHIDFILQILVPYFSQISPNVQKIVNCFNNIILLETDPEEIYKKQLLMMKILQKMRNKSKQKRIKRGYSQIQLCFVKHFVEDRTILCQKLKKRNQLYAKSAIKQFQSYIFKKLNH